MRERGEKVKDGQGKASPIFIAVEGPIGVGKTTLAKKLAGKLNAFLLKEIVEENPFLADFYEDRSEWSLQTEMFFLCNRFKQLEDLNKNMIALNHSVVADYHIFKNMIFAKQNLSNEHFEKYKQIYQILVRDLPMPDFVIYLRAGVDTLMERIRNRGREFEQKIDGQYLQSLTEAYDLFLDKFHTEHPNRVFMFNGDQLDFVNREEDEHYIIQTVLNALHMEMN